MARSSTPILEATIRLIARGGVNAVRYRDVAAESGVALGTISYQYPSREELLRSAIAHYIAENTMSLRNFASTARLEKPEDVATLFEAVLQDSFAAPYKQNLAEYELMLYAARDPLVAKAVAEWDRRIVVELAEILERVGVPSPLSTAQTLLEMIRGFELSALSQPAPNLDDFIKRVMRVVLGLCLQAEVPTKKARTSPRVRRSRPA
jgi:TetR/AcrR family transcriptional regulator, regulator of biofilm formation and stress response